MRIAWTTDIHLNFLSEAAQREFLKNLQDARADALLISGDIGEAHTVANYLLQIENALQRPIYFVLGNHDFYFGSIFDVRRRITALSQQRSQLHYLTASGCYSLTRTTAIVGHDGWADGREGDYLRSYVMMHDARLIDEFKRLGKVDRWQLLKKYGDEAAAHIQRVLPQALEQHEHVLLLTHVPPIRGACWYNGQISDDEWAPHFTCQALGCAMLDIMQQHADKRVTVFCGHTHGCGEVQPLPNVTIHTGGAEYGHPVITRVFDIE